MPTNRRLHLVLFPPYKILPRNAKPETFVWGKKWRTQTPIGGYQYYSSRVLFSRTAIMVMFCSGKRSKSSPLRVPLLYVFVFVLGGERVLCWSGLTETWNH